ncbi:hypothetical protein B0H19DRAFT_1157547 [Mycena capillaripes]|nr:hypothetical protein B0H19DRAFT_1157547 [Mycena capillaripes]
MSNSVSARHRRQRRGGPGLADSSPAFPVSTLLNEIVTEIFLHFPPTYPLCPPLTGPLSPTSLTHVCRQWREIALATPALWRAIPFTDDNDIPWAQKTHMFKAWLSRSRHCLLSINIVGFEVHLSSRCSSRSSLCTLGASEASASVLSFICHPRPDASSPLPRSRICKSK